MVVSGLMNQILAYVVWRYIGWDGLIEDDMGCDFREVGEVETGEACLGRILYGLEVL